MPWGQPEMTLVNPSPALVNPSPAAATGAAAPSLPGRTWQKQQFLSLNGEARFFGPSSGIPPSPMPFLSAAVRGIAPMMMTPSFFLPGPSLPPAVPSPASGTGQRSRLLSSLPPAVCGYSVTPSMLAAPSVLQALIGAFSEPRPPQAAWQHRHLPKGVVAPQICSEAPPVEQRDERTGTYLGGVPTVAEPEARDDGSSDSDSEDGMAAAEALTMLATGVRPAPPGSTVRSRMGLEASEGCMKPLTLSLGETPAACLDSPAACGSLAPLGDTLLRCLDLRAVLSPHPAGNHVELSCPESLGGSSNDGAPTGVRCDSSAAFICTTNQPAEGASVRILRQPDVLASLECLKGLAWSPRQVPVRYPQLQTPCTTDPYPPAGVMQRSADPRLGNNHWELLDQADALRKHAAGGARPLQGPDAAMNQTSTAPSALDLLQSMGRDLTDSIVLCKVRHWFESAFIWYSTGI